MRWLIDIIVWLSIRRPRSVVATIVIWRHVVLWRWRSAFLYWIYTIYFICRINIIIMNCHEYVYCPLSIHIRTKWVNFNIYILIIERWNRNKLMICYCYENMHEITKKICLPKSLIKFSWTIIIEVVCIFLQNEVCIISIQLRTEMILQTNRIHILHIAHTTWRGK